MSSHVNPVNNSSNQPIGYNMPLQGGGNTTTSAVTNNENLAASPIALKAFENVQNSSSTVSPVTNANAVSQLPSGTNNRLSNLAGGGKV